MLCSLLIIRTHAPPPHTHTHLEMTHWINFFIECGWWMYVGVDVDIFFITYALEVFQGF